MITIPQMKKHLLLLNRLMRTELKKDIIPVPSKLSEEEVNKYFDRLFVKKTEGENEYYVPIKSKVELKIDEELFKGLIKKKATIKKSKIEPKKEEKKSEPQENYKDRLLKDLDRYKKRLEKITKEDDKLTDRGLEPINDSKEYIILRYEINKITTELNKKNIIEKTENQLIKEYNKYRKRLDKITKEDEKLSEKGLESKNDGSEYVILRYEINKITKELNKKNIIEKPESEPKKEEPMKEEPMKEEPKKEEPKKEELMKDEEEEDIEFVQDPEKLSKTVREFLMSFVKESLKKFNDNYIIKFVNLRKENKLNDEAYYDLTRGYLNLSALSKYYALQKYKTLEGLVKPYIGKVKQMIIQRNKESEKNIKEMKRVRDIRKKEEEKKMRKDFKEEYKMEKEKLKQEAKDLKMK